MLELARDWRRLPLSEAEQAMLAYTEIVALNPSAATAEHIAELRRVGFSDAEIFEIVLVTAYYALRCRMADALGVEVDTDKQQDAALVAAFAFRTQATPE